MMPPTDECAVPPPNAKQRRQWQYALARRIVDLGRIADKPPDAAPQTSPERMDTAATPAAAPASPQVDGEPTIAGPIS
jgi:hypothetical protein